MNTKNYVKKFKLDLGDKEFDRDGFIREFEKEFLERVKITQNLRKGMGLSFEYNIFSNIIKEMQDKFNSISNKKLGEPLPHSLFSVFYARTVIPLRGKLFPEIHEKIRIYKNSKFAEFEKES